MPKKAHWGKLATTSTTVQPTVRRQRLQEPLLPLAQTQHRMHSSILMVQCQALTLGTTSDPRAPK